MEEPKKKNSLDELKNIAIVDAIYGKRDTTDEKNILKLFIVVNSDNVVGDLDQLKSLTEELHRIKETGKENDEVINYEILTYASINERLSHEEEKKFQQEFNTATVIYDRHGDYGHLDESGHKGRA